MNIIIPENDYPDREFEEQTLYELEHLNPNLDIVTPEWDS